MFPDYLLRKFIAILACYLSLLLSCGDKENPVGSEDEYSRLISDHREVARGLWQAISGDISSSGPGLITSNWYAINPIASSDTVLVTWDDGLACTTTPGTMSKEGEIRFAAIGVEAIFEILSTKKILARFYWNGKTFKKELEKLRDDPTVLCD
ncbi:MAG: hypothetical protein ONB05_09425 [candidate division KSB1 bacterium]|nr:hypothetical protein [candidate division KSB1 bacterium]